MPKKVAPERRTPAVVDAHVGSRIKMQRRIAGLSQVALAKALGVTFQQVQKYENGRNRVSASRLQQISGFLNVPISLFFEGIEEAQGAAGQDYLATLSGTTGGLSLARAFGRVKDRRVRKALVELTTAVAEAEE